MVQAAAVASLQRQGLNNLRKGGFSQWLVLMITKWVPLNLHF